MFGDNLNLRNYIPFDKWPVGGRYATLDRRGVVQFWSALPRFVTYCGWDFCNETAASAVSASDYREFDIPRQELRNWDKSLTARPDPIDEIHLKGASLVIPFVAWPKDATHAVLNGCDRSVVFWDGEPWPDERRGKWTSENTPAHCGPISEYRGIKDFLTDWRTTLTKRPEASNVEEEATEQPQVEASPSDSARPEEGASEPGGDDATSQAVEAEGSVKAEEWQKRLELHNAPSWDDAPVNATHRCMDINGEWQWCSLETESAPAPTEEGGWRFEGGGEWFLAKRSSYAVEHDPDFWKQSLEARPGRTVEIGGSAKATVSASMNDDPVEWNPTAGPNIRLDERGNVGIGTPGHSGAERKIDIDGERLDDTLHGSEVIPREELIQLQSDCQHYADEAEMLQVKLDALRASVSHVCWKLGQPGYGDVADEVCASLEYALDEFGGEDE